MNSMRTRKLAYDRCLLPRYMPVKVLLSERFKILVTGYWRVRTFTIGFNVGDYLTTEVSFGSKETLDRANLL